MNTTVPSANPDPLVLGVNGFNPWYTPVEMMTMGVYGGAYFHKLASRNFINPEVFDALVDSQYSKRSPNFNLNKFEVEGKAFQFGMGMSIMSRNKTPYGFFQWYTKLWSSITYNNLVGWDNQFDRNWVDMWQTMIKMNWYYIANAIYEGEGDRYTDLAFMPQQRQALLEYGWDPTKNPVNYGIYG